MRFEVYGQDELVEILKDKEYPGTSCISITNPGVISEYNPDHINNSFVVPPVFEKSFDSLIKLKFWDADSMSFFSVLNIPENELVKRLPVKDDINEIISFYNRTKDHCDCYVVHCLRGVSRSTAVMLCIMYLHYQDEDRAIEELYMIRPKAQPLWLILSMFDEIVGSKLYKRLIELEEEAVAEMERKWVEEEKKNPEVARKNMFIRGLI